MLLDLLIYKHIVQFPTPAVIIFVELCSILNRYISTIFINSGEFSLEISIS